MRKFIVATFFIVWGWAVAAQQVVVAALGDSLVQGYGLQQQDGFVPRLETWLKAQGADVAMINAGVSGDTAASGAARASWTLTPEVDALIVVLGGNDMLRGIDPGVTRGHLDRVMRVAAGANVPVLLVGQKAPGNYGPDYQAQFDAIYPELAAEYGAILYDNFFAALVAKGTDVATLRRYMQRDGIHPNPRGVQVVVDDIGPYALQLVNRAAAGG